MTEYAMTFCDKHVAVIDKKGLDFSLGFKVRRFNDRIFIISAEQGDWQIGAQIIEVDGQAIDSLGQQYDHILPCS
ncbi:hypothetical protein [Alkalihalobacillus pseudalcaliphilus]|uniref:hypothetical protein n=1 Tax=Alkalihalobacillus pseudalcaliphilus TaxID=79884 RepID=UPI00064E0C19|nr:hypothetical protein [Alkalihalobacillus pseudalcaliphilus]KMK75827.1 hypothetical protein AB990_11220 [Alkalihalobacillus pseudalcaliphilus]